MFTLSYAVMLISEFARNNEEILVLLSGMVFGGSGAQSAPLPPKTIPSVGNANIFEQKAQ
jgi:hypothetical protein